jgi:hypothetical protein
MSINGNGDTLTITGARLKVSGGVQVSGSIAYTDDATGFGGVSAQIDADNTTLNITAGKTSGVAKIERGTTTNITGINHANVSNNTTIHIALKNTSSNKGDFVTIGTFADDDTVKVNYTDEYVIGPGETGMLTLRKVAGVLSLFIREMFSSNATDTDTKPFYIKDGTNYKYPLYKSSDNGGGNLEGVTINGVQYYRPSSGLKTKTRPPLGIPELIVSPSGNLAIGNSADLTTVNYDVWGVPSSFGFGSIYQGGTKKTSFVLENGEASGSFTESGASSGDAYTLYVERTDLSTSDTVYIDTSAFIGTIAFHHDTFANSGDPYGDGTLAGASANNHVFADTQTGTYTWGTLSGNALTSTETTYTWTPPNEITGADVLMVAGGGGGATSYGGGGGAGGLLHYTNQTVSGQKTIVIGNGGIEVVDGSDTSFTGLTTVIGGGAAGNVNNTGNNGGSGGGGGSSNASSTTYAGGSPEPGQGNQGGLGTNSGSQEGYKGGGGGGAGTSGQNASETASTAGGNGGAGLDYSSIFGTGYGHNGYFAGGGGGGVIWSGWAQSMTGGDGGIGGGGDGGDSYNTTNSVGSNGSPGMTHTGGGGGASGFNATGGSGGSGIVLIKTDGIGKKIPKVTGASFDSTNVTFTVQGSMSDIKYTINGGSEQTTPVGTLAVAHGLSASASITVVAYAVDANGDQISAKKTVTGTIIQPTLVNTISLTGGDWSTQTPVGQYDYITTNTNSTYYEYELSIASGNSNYYIAYNWTTKKWFDTNTNTADNTFGTSATDLSNTSRETTENPAVVYVFGATQLEAQFNNPYYQS